MSDHIIDRLKSQDAADPIRSSARIFLENYGHNRDEELCKILTHFISLADNITLYGVQFVAPMRHTSSDVRNNSFVLLHLLDRQVTRYMRTTECK